MLTVSLVLSLGLVSSGILFLSHKKESFTALFLFPLLWLLSLVGWLSSL